MKAVILAGGMGALRGRRDGARGAGRWQVSRRLLGYVVKLPSGEWHDGKSYADKDFDGYPWTKDAKKRRVFGGRRLVVDAMGVDEREARGEAVEPVGLDEIVPGDDGLRGGAEQGYGRDADNTGAGKTELAGVHGRTSMVARPKPTFFA